MTFAIALYMSSEKRKRVKRLIFISPYFTVENINFFIAPLPILDSVVRVGTQEPISSWNIVCCIQGMILSVIDFTPNQIKEVNRIWNNLLNNKTDKWIEYAVHKDQLLRIRSSRSDNLRWMC